MRHLARLSLSVLVPLFLVVLGGAAAASEKVCQEVRLTKRPGWTNSGAWSASGDLLIADARQKVVLRYSGSGRALGTIPEPLSSNLEDFFPQTISSQQGKLIVQAMGGDLIALDKSYRPQIQRDTSLIKGARPETRGRSIQGVQQWQPVGAEGIIALADINGPQPDAWETAFVRFPLARPQDFKVLAPVPESATSPYFVGHPYIASEGSIGYALLVDQGLRLLVAAPNMKPAVRPILNLPQALDQGPPVADIVPGIVTTEDVVSIMDTVERSTMPVGLYAWERSLFLLWRKPEGAASRWFLTKIDPARSAAVGTVSINVRANHLTVVPGPESWAFIEKGRVRGWGVQNIDTVLLVRSERMRTAFREGAGTSTALCRQIH